MERPGETAESGPRMDPQIARLLSSSVHQAPNYSSSVSPTRNTTGAEYPANRRAALPARNAPSIDEQECAASPIRQSFRSLRHVPSDKLAARPTAKD